ncbi:hypothetical protein [Chitinophaga agri]|uniref:Uncharacterized protein n=1 Tax=Chitinophaga agri TaxID=2703787 RepID=A0A6B9ZQL6_9BACT|nr:hypothetical protein [Chitinophaga agri]QHS63895.1 hypothetical protein GWR21_31240 [Chitinophaga agri]
MIKRLAAVCSLLILAACGSSKREVMQSVKDKHLLQEKTVNDYVFRLQYMPPEKVADDTALLYFRLNITNSQTRQIKGTSDQGASYGLDTLFCLVAGTDTLIPVDVNRIANGTLNGAEYMLVFDKQAVRRQPESRLVFRDWLFTHQYLVFPVSGSAISQIDSLSLNI